MASAELGMIDQTGAGLHSSPIAPQVAAGSAGSARVLVVAADGRQAPRAAAWLVDAGAGPVWTAADRPTALQAARAHQPEVAIVDLGFQECEGPAVALQLRLAARHLETVFFAGPRDQAAMAAAKDLGLDRVVAFDDLRGIVTRLLVPLAECVRLRRRLDEVEGLLRRYALATQGGRESQNVALPEGERRYRETYLRSLLAETGNRREAARRAGVPYTTLSDMMRKLGITDNEQP